VKEGTARRAQLLEDLAAQIAAGRIGSVVGFEKGLLGSQVPPLIEDGEEGPLPLCGHDSFMCAVFSKWI
jgi:hypothetical protein